MRKSLILAASAILCLSVPAIGAAQDIYAAGAVRLGDLDRDGVVSAREAGRITGGPKAVGREIRGPARATARTENPGEFRIVDNDRDGVISLGEVAAVMNETETVIVMNVFDADADGAISRAEVEALASQGPHIAVLAGASIRFAMAQSSVATN